MRLRRVDCSRAGIRRLPRGRGFSYVDATGARVTDPETLDRIASLVIPPAWRDVWICPIPNGHIQATGTDAAGRRQYRYHDAWRTARDQEKHDRMLAFAAKLPAARNRINRDLTRPDLDRLRVLAAAVRLLDVAFFRIGSEEYAETNHSFGLSTLLREHATCRDGAVHFDFPAKSGQRRIQSVSDPSICQVVTALKRRRGGGEELLAYREAGRWQDLAADEINDYLREITRGDFTAKDFRTWHATVLCAVALAVTSRETLTESGRKRAISRAVTETAHYLGNTPAVARASYIDPRVIDRFNDGVTIAAALDRLGEGTDVGDLATRGAVERAVLTLLKAPRSADRQPRRLR